MDIDAALDILESVTVPFDRVQQTLKGNLKHHLLPQTHPFNCLHLADHILRQETLAADMEDLPLAGLAQLPSFRQSVSPKSGLSLSAQQRGRLHRIYAQDYAQLGYDYDGHVVGEVAIKPSSKAGIWPLWPAFFCENAIDVARAESALPAPDVDLAPFVVDIIRGVPKSTWPSRDNNLIAHFHKFLPECVSQARIAHLAACCIVVIRRTGGSGAGLTLFHRILKDHGDVVFADMNSR